MSLVSLKTNQIIKWLYYFASNGCLSMFSKNYSIYERHFSFNESTKSTKDNTIKTTFDKTCSVQKISQASIELYGLDLGKQKQYSTASGGSDDDSLPKVSSHAARYSFPPEVEQALNDQIVGEFRAASHFFLAACHFGRTDVGLYGTRDFFMKMHEQEKAHGMALIDFQLLRGGSVKLGQIAVSDITSDKLSSISKALELTLQIEMSVSAKLDDLVHLAVRNNDKKTEDFLNHKFLREQHNGLREIGSLYTRSILIDIGSISEYLFDKEMATAVGHSTNFERNGG